MKMIHQMIPNPRMLVQGYEPMKIKRVRPKKRCGLLIELN